MLTSSITPESISLNITITNQKRRLTQRVVIAHIILASVFVVSVRTGLMAELLAIKKQLAAKTARVMALEAEVTDMEEQIAALEAAVAEQDERAPTTFRYNANLQAWCDAGEEDPLEPMLAIVDPHHHLWPSASKQMASGQTLPAALANCFGERHAIGPFYYDDFDKDARRNNVVASVFVECGAFYSRADAAKDPSTAHMLPVRETTGVAAVADKATRPMRIVGHVDLRAGAEVARRVLEAHLAAGKGADGRQHFVGIRHVLAWDASDDIYSAKARGQKQGASRDPAFREALAVLGEMGLTFDTWCFFTNIPEVAELARAVPSVTIVLDHIGFPLGVGPYRRDPSQNGSTPGGDGGPTQTTMAAWKASMADLATCPNVVVKLSGLTMPIAGFGWERGDRPPSSAELAAAMAPYYEYVIKAFGVGRCMFASNFPPDRASGSYTTLWNAFKRIARNLDGGKGVLPEAMAALFHDTAARVYRIGGEGGAKL